MVTCTTVNIQVGVPLEFFCSAADTKPTSWTFQGDTLTIPQGSICLVLSESGGGSEVYMWENAIPGWNKIR